MKQTYQIGNKQYASKSLAQKMMIDEIFKNNPNARILLCGIKENKIIVSENNTDFKLYSNESLPKTTP